MIIGIIKSQSYYPSPATVAHNQPPVPETNTPKCTLLCLSLSRSICNAGGSQGVLFIEVSWKFSVEVSGKFKSPRLVRKSEVPLAVETSQTNHHHQREGPHDDVLLSGTD